MFHIVYNAQKKALQRTGRYGLNHLYVELRKHVALKFGIVITKLRDSDTQDGRICTEQSTEHYCVRM